MPTILLTDVELADAAHAAQLASAQAADDASKQSNPGVRQVFTKSAARFDGLAVKFTSARPTAPTQD